jgi:hypothetical protein
VTGPGPATTDVRVEYARLVLAQYRSGEPAPEGSVTASLAEATRELLTLAEDALDEDERRNASHVSEDGGVWLTPADALTMAKAREDAAELLAERVDECTECEGDTVCEACGDRAVRIESYRDLGRRLGGDR